MKRIITILAILIASATFCAAQSDYYNSGKAKYRQIKNDYNRKEYVSSPTDKYSRGWAGVGSAVIPGLGQALDGEWGRAAGFFFGNIGLKVLAGSSMNYNTDAATGKTTLEGTPYTLCFIAADLALGIWSIIDAVHVAQVKNMYLQDISGRASFDFDLQPYFAYDTHIGNRPVPTAGLSMIVTF